MSLTEEILQNISEYNMAPFDAEINVIEAQMEACVRDIQIASECEKLGIVMEGAIIPSRDGENIFKYILFFIPRVVINLLLKLREWITGQHIPTGDEIKKLEAEEEKKAKAAEDDAMVEATRRAVIDIINGTVAQKVPTSTTRMGVNGGYAIVSNLNIPAVFQTFREFDKYFDDYTSIFERLDSRDNIATDDDVINFEKAISKITTNGISNVYFQKPIPTDGFVELARSIKGKDGKGELQGIMKNIESKMNSLIKKYHEMMENSKKISSYNLDFARQYFNMIKTSHAMFISFSEKVITETNAAIIAISELRPTSEKVMKRYQQSKEIDYEHIEKILKEKGVIANGN